MKTTTRRLTETGVLIAMALALLFLSKLIVPFFQLPFGGEVTFVSMLPIVLIGYRFGTRWGLFGAFSAFAGRKLYHCGNAGGRAGGMADTAYLPYRLYFGLYCAGVRRPVP